MMDPAAYEEWKRTTKKGRLNNFSPLRVRTRLESAAIPVPIAEARYSRFCEVATHVTPHTKPQAYNLLGVPVAGAYFQEAGAIVTLNELAAATSLATVPLPKLLDLQVDERKRIREACLVLLRCLGAVDVLTIEDMWERMLNRQSGERNSNGSQTA